MMRSFQLQRLMVTVLAVFTWLVIIALFTIPVH
jgi:hypothetical protein